MKISVLNYMKEIKQNKEREKKEMRKYVIHTTQYTYYENKIKRKEEMHAKQKTRRFFDFKSLIRNMTKKKGKNLMEYKWFSIEFVVSRKN